MTETTGTEIRTPFVDDSLLEQRQQQREVLLSIPKWLADKVRDGADAAPDASLASAAPTPPTVAQRLLIERHARDQVDELLDQLQVALVPVIDRGVAEVIDAHLVGVLQRRASKGATAWRAELAEDLAAEIEIDEDALGRLIDLLLIADGLANDGFTDLRFG